MDHSHIAKVYDAGATPSGRPYFVMELVEGVPITRFCNEAQLDATNRLRLFIDVCSAIQHAHQKGVIHRDLKPSNVLVAERDGKPMPMVIDFGIAKATCGKLSEITLATRVEQVLGTPVYMSPEQADLRNTDVDTRSDIYSMGVLLYELLVGKPPFDPQDFLQAGVEEMRRIIREDEPLKPSTRVSHLTAMETRRVFNTHRADRIRLESLLRGDLDWIVMKAIERKENVATIPWADWRWILSGIFGMSR